MRKIYLEKRCIIICTEDDQVLTDPNAIRFTLGDECGLKKMIELFEVSDTLQRIYIATDDIDNAYSKVCNEFLEVNAGGGLVENRRGDFLLINRNGLWDLPKGHQDPGEDIKITALREVQEETGIELPPKNGRVVWQYSRGNAHKDIWLFDYEFDLDKIVLQEGETCDKCAASREEIEGLMAQGKFVPVHYWREKAFERVIGKTKP